MEESVLDRQAGQLSGGECLRVSIARALLMQPAILICDESTSSLDGHTRDGIIELLRRLMEERMDKGKIVETGAAADVIGYPTHSVSKRLFAPYATFGETGRP